MSSLTLLTIIVSRSLRTFATDWRKAQVDKNRQIRQRLAEERAVLFKDVTISPELRIVLGEIFCMYADDRHADIQCASESTLTLTMAARLWYRCGMKLTGLEKILDTRDDSKHAGLTLQDFLRVIEKILQEDEASGIHEPTLDLTVVSSCEVSALLYLETCL